MTLWTKGVFVRSFEVTPELVNNWSFQSSSKYKILFYKGIRQICLECNISAIGEYFLASYYTDPL